MSIIPDSPIGSILARLDSVKPAGDGKWLARCPAHDDRNASLSIGTGDDGRVLLNCFAGCETKTICAALGMRTADLFPPREQSNGHNKPSNRPTSNKGKRYQSAAAAIAALDRRHGPHSAQWTYHDANGKAVGTIVRFDGANGKDIRPVAFTENGWIIGGMLKPRPLYCLPELLVSTGIVFVPEGEKCADFARSIGLVATTSPGGSQGYASADWTPLAGREVVLLPDADKPGEIYSAAVAKILLALSPPARVKILRLPGLSDGEDIVDCHQRQEEAGEERETPLAVEIENMAAKLEWETATEPATAEDGQREPQSTRHLTDTGNGQCFARQHGQIVRHVHDWKKWLSWDGKRWRHDDAGQSKALAKKTVLHMYHEAGAMLLALKEKYGNEIEKDDAEGDQTAKIMMRKIKATLAWAHKSQSAPRINAILDLARSEPGIPLQPCDLDTNPWLLNCENGTIDLKTGRLREHRQCDYLTNIVPTTFDARAKCPIWERFVSQILADRKNVVEYMQRLIGYFLTGVVHEHILPIFHGVGANGKSVFINTIFNMLGENYSGKCPRDLLMAIKNDRHPASMAWLFGKRFAAAVETAEGARMDEALIKELTGDDKINARRMHENPWEFLPTHKICLVTNHRPQVRGTDHGIWRRLRLIPFEVVFADSQQDKRLTEKLRGELPGILAWAVRGCLEWQRVGLADAPEVLAATEAYKSDEDRLGTFLAESCKLNREFRAKISDVYSAFAKWCESTGDRATSGKAFTQALAEREIERDTGRRWYLGIALSEDTGD